MKPREKGGVVDARLNVYGVQNLKVADLSICPSVIAAVCHTKSVCRDCMLTFAMSTLEWLRYWCPCGREGCSYHRGGDGARTKPLR